LTAERFYTDDGIRWFRTGDTGELVDGVLRVTGRIDDAIISGGVKVSLAAVERVVRTLPDLSDAVVIPAADERWGEVPVVVATTAIDLEVLRKHVADQLGPAARPSRVVVVDQIPTLASGKPNRQALAGR
ncbi:MAG: o-succinylbenzoate--CoA ligase, partial [Terrimesophilobacter sp.]